MLRVLRQLLKLLLPQAKNNMSLLNRLILVPIIFIIGTIFLISAQAEESYPFLGKVKADQINVRSGANTNFERIDQLPVNALVIVINKQYEWYQIYLLPTSQAYIRADYLLPINEEIYEVKGDRVNIRARANSDSSSMGQMSGGTLIRVAEIKEGWARIIAPWQITGWVNEKFIERLPQPVPEEMMPRPIQRPDPTLSQSAESKSDNAKTAPGVEVTAIGFIKPATRTESREVQYQLFIEDKPIYNLTDVPQMGQFFSYQVKVKGRLKSANKTGDLPILIVTEITLVK